MWSETNFTKYGRYIMDIIDRYLKEGRRPACSIETEAAYLAGGPRGNGWKMPKDTKRCIAAGAVSDEALMQLVLLPLTYKGEEKKQTAIRECVELARKIPDKEEE